MEPNNKIRFTSTVTMDLEEFTNLQNSMKVDQDKIKQLSAILESHSRFLRELDSNDKVVTMYLNNLNKTQKIGSSFFQAFQEFNELIKNDLIPK